MENTNKVLKNFAVTLVYFQRNQEAWIQCKVTYHLQAISVYQALLFAVYRLEGVSMEEIEDTRIEREL